MRRSKGQRWCPVLLVLVLGACGGEAPADAGVDLGSLDASLLDSGVGTDGGTDSGLPCGDGGLCAFGQSCQASQCVALECHPGSASRGVDALKCDDGFVCDFLLDSEGDGVCVAYAPSCQFDSDCVFGFRCAGSATCVRSECHAGGILAAQADYAPRPCESGTCEFGDGVDLNGGRGTCVP